MAQPKLSRRLLLGMVLCVIVVGCAGKDENPPIDFFVLADKEIITQDEVDDIVSRVRSEMVEQHRGKLPRDEQELALYEYWLNATPTFYVGYVYASLEPVEGAGSEGVFVIDRATLAIQFEGETVYYLDDSEKTRSVHAELRVDSENPRTWRVVKADESVGLLPEMLPELMPEMLPYTLSPFQ